MKKYLYVISILLVSTILNATQEKQLQDLSNLLYKNNFEQYKQELKNFKKFSESDQKLIVKQLSDYISDYQRHYNQTSEGRPPHFKNINRCKVEATVFLLIATQYVVPLLICLHYPFEQWIRVWLFNYFGWGILSLVSGVSLDKRIAKRNELPFILPFTLLRDLADDDERIRENKKQWQEILDRLAIDVNKKE